MTEFTVILTIILTFCLTLSFIAVTCGILALIKVIAMEKSTHTMQYVSTEEELKNYTKQENTANWDLDSNWATSPETLADQQKKYTEDLKDEGLDFFLPTDDDKKKYSF